MFRPVSLFVGMRYTRAKRRNHFISFISLVSMLGIALGITVLITVLSVMNGFDQEIRTRIFELAPQVVIKNFSGKIDNWQQLETDLARVPNLLATAPLVEGQGMLTHDGVVRPVLVDGVDPAREGKVSEIAEKMVYGKLTDLEANEFRIILGNELAKSLGVEPGDFVTLVIPETTVSIMGIEPRFKRFQVVGIFAVGNGFGFDSQLAVINFSDAQKLFQLGDAVTGLRLKINDFFAAPFFAKQIAGSLSPDYFVTDWTQQYGPLFKAIKLEKTMMFFILLLIVAVAAFNLVSSLVMLVNEKRSDIAILRTLGATPGTVMRIFVIQGFVVGLIGTGLGIIGGIVLALNVTDVVTFIQNTFNVQFLSPNVYYVDYLPSKLEAPDILEICMASFFLCLLATLYPAWRAARTQPAEALRYD